MKVPFVLCLACFAPLAMAETPQQILGGYTNEALSSAPDFKASSQRGAALFQRSFAVTEKMPACTSCHTSNPRQEGEHVITGKRIRPMAVSADNQRFTEAAKVEKWFARNCKEVLGRPCSAAEKADVVAYMSGVR